jgi:agmatine deiminase
MPAEFAPHERTMMGFPCRTELWGRRLREAQLAWAALARTIADFEPVTMLARPADAELAAALCAHGNVDVIEIPLDDSWLRDTGPIYVTAPGRRVAMDFRFNGWGGRYVPFDSDDAVPRRWSARRDEERIAVDLVLEGGAITVDGEGTLITTEQCLLHPNRNPDRTRADIEAALRESLGVETIVWLPYAIDDRDTDGHVDLVAMFIEPGRVLWQGCEDRRDPEHDRLATSRRVLARTVDAVGRALEVVDVPVLPYCEVDGLRLPVPYANAYLCNGAVIVPVTGHAADDDMLDIIRGAWPDRAVVPVPGEIIAFGGGGPHCTTQQIPAVPPRLAPPD